MYNTIIYYKDHGNKYRTYDIDADEYKTIGRLPLKYNKFPLEKPYEATDEDLKNYSKNLIHDSKEIEENTKIKYNILNYEYKDRYGNIKYFYKNQSNITLHFLKTVLKKYDLNEGTVPLSNEEYLIGEDCYNGGSRYYENHDKILCYEYDYKIFFPYLLSSRNFNFPIDVGRWEIFDKLPDKYNDFQYGYYLCEIEIFDKTIEKIFNISSKNTYTHFSMTMAMCLKKKFGDKIIIKPKGKCYIYDKLESGREMFLEWYNILFDLKQRFPKNKLVKTLSSKVWGYLSTKQVLIIYENDERLNDMKLTTKPNKKDHYFIKDYVTTEDEENNYYVLIDPNKSPQKYNYRLKPFLLSYSRLKMFNTYYSHLEDIVYMNTDGVLLTKPFKYLRENKQIKFEGCNHYKINNGHKNVIS